MSAMREISLSKILLCFNTLFRSSKEQSNVEEQPFLETSEQQDEFSAAGIWSKLTFLWLNPLLKKGYREKLEFQNVPPIPRSEAATEAFSSLKESLGNQRANKDSLWKAILRTLWRPLALNAAFAGANTIALYVGPLLITCFVNFLSEKNDVAENWDQGLIIALVFFSAKTVESISQRHWYFGAHRIVIRLRAALMVMIYRKSLSTKYVGMSTGKIINLMDGDIERIGDLCWHIHEIWLLPVQVILALAILYQNLGAAPSFAALATTTLVMLSNTPLAKVQKRFHTKIMEAKDSRMRATSETLRSMRVLKLHSWESTFLEKLLQLREIERSWVKKYLYTCSAVAFLFWASPTLISAVTFGVCVMLKAPLTSNAVLSAIATFRILQEPIYNLPELVSMASQAKVSLDRIENFITTEDDEILPICDPAPHASGVAVEIEAAEYAWGTDDSKKATITITDRIRIMKGQTAVICGSLGSGKSSLLLSILGEIPRTSGASVKTFGTKALVPQSAWIQMGTIQDNVLFGKEMERDIYEDVVRRCALNQDFQMWRDGDLSRVGERGINLSGGQKQRIQLARAIYSDSDILLLDDPLSAVDVHTGTHIFKECLKKLLPTKTVIYVTHQLEFLDASYFVLVMKDGKIVQSGKYQDLIADPENELNQQIAAHMKTLDQVKAAKQCTHSTKDNHRDNQSEITENNFRDLAMNSRLLGKNQKEETNTGRVKWHVYSTFITSAYKGMLVPVILLCHVLFFGLQMASNYWIAWGTDGRVDSARLVGIFILLSAGSSFFILGRATLLSTAAIETSQCLFLGMTTSIFRAPLSFFESTPSSRILSRSSTDQSTVDTDLPYRVAGLAFALIQLLSVIILMSQVAWQVIFLFLIIIAISIWYQAYYISTARELARMVGIQKAPILHHLSESVSGAATIRCFNQEDRFLRKNLDLIDDYSRVAFHNSATVEWLSIRINFLFNLVFFLLLVILVNLPRSAVDPSLAGLAATYGLSLNVLQAWIIWNLCNVENKMICVERILQFTNIPSEAPLIIEDCRPHSEWPLHGRIEIENLHVQYSPSLPKVLKGITCTFPAAKKIGIVGRTGSGKSTLIQSLFRVVEPSDGRIIIDGLDICKIGLQDLRSKLSVIPQDPTLFQGTVRSNVDPLEQYPDHEIWEVLHKCHLAGIVKLDERLLDAPVAENGENWSLGQRQLICLARALLQKRRVLVLDEATSAVDTMTDNVIQKTIREETSRCTVLTVAHRIPTVVDNDIVLVLAEGKVVEYDAPARLLNDKSSAFSDLVTEFLRRSS